MMRIFQTDSFTADKELTGIGLELSGKNVNQGALPGAVFAEKRVDLARLYEEVHASQRQRVAETFTDTASRDDGRRSAHSNIARRYDKAIGLLIFQTNRLSKSQRNRRY